MEKVYQKMKKKATPLASGSCQKTETMLSLLPMSDHHTKVVVAVDDNMINLRTIELALAPYFDVRVAKSAEAALNLIAALKTVDLLLLDIEMPGMNGLVLLGELRKKPVTAASPVVFVTSQTTTDTVHLAKDLGAVSFVVKPYTIPALLTKVFQALDITDITVDSRGEVRAVVM
jgi:CheY-like chemotaxis protein